MYEHRRNYIFQLKVKQRQRWKRQLPRLFPMANLEHRIVDLSCLGEILTHPRTCTYLWSRSVAVGGYIRIKVSCVWQRSLSGRRSGAEAGDMSKCQS